MAKRTGTMILNATRGSFLDVFPTVDLDDLIDKRTTQGDDVPAARSTSQRLMALTVQ